MTDNAEAKCERLRAALQEIECDSYGRVARIARTALDADQQGEREDGMADVSWKRQLERTRNDAWNAALEASTQATEDEDGDLYTKPIPLRTRLKTIIAPSRSLRDTARVIRRNATAEIRSLKRGTP